MLLTLVDCSPNGLCTRGGGLGAGPARLTVLGAREDVFGQRRRCFCPREWDWLLSLALLLPFCVPGSFGPLCHSSCFYSCRFPL